MSDRAQRRRRDRPRRPPPLGVYTPKPGVGPADVSKDVFQERPSASAPPDAGEA